MKNVVILTGAGISAESGISTFRDSDGLWEQYRVEDVATYEAYLRNPELVINFYNERRKGAFLAEPNEAHRQLVRLEEKYNVQIITQNIDNLHQDAGNTVVHEFHGTASTLLCLDCQERFTAQNFSFAQMPPKCPKCGGRIKPDFVFYGEGIPEKPYRMSMIEADEADVFLVIGTTGEVMPACMIPQIARQNGAKVIEINISPSALTRSTTTHFLQGKAGEVMTALMKEIKGSGLRVKG